MNAIQPPEPGQVSLEVLATATSVRPGARFAVTVRLTNRLGSVLASLAPHPVNLSYHWVERASGEVVVFDGLRTRLPRPISPGEAVNVVLEVEAPPASRDLRLVLSAVQEGIAWWDRGAAIDVVDFKPRGVALQSDLSRVQ